MTGQGRATADPDPSATWRLHAAEGSTHTVHARVGRSVAPAHRLRPTPFGARRPDAMRTHARSQPLGRDFRDRTAPQNSAAPGRGSSLGEASLRGNNDEKAFDDARAPPRKDEGQSRSASKARDKSCYSATEAGR